jgi:hypothetical protein
MIIVTLGTLAVATAISSSAARRAAASYFLRPEARDARKTGQDLALLAVR